MEFTRTIDLEVDEAEASKRASLWFDAAGYRRREGADDVFERGDTVGSTAAVSPDKWRATTRLAKLRGPTGLRIRIAIDVDTKLQIVTTRERVFWETELEDLVVTILTGRVQRRSVELSQQVVTFGAGLLAAMVGGGLLGGGISLALWRLGGLSLKIGAASALVGVIVSIWAIRRLGDGERKRGYALIVGMAGALLLSGQFSSRSSRPAGDAKKPEARPPTDVEETTCGWRDCMAIYGVRDVAGKAYTLLALWSAGQPDDCLRGGGLGDYLSRIERRFGSDAFHVVAVKSSPAGDTPDCKLGFTTRGVRYDIHPVVKGAPMDRMVYLIPTGEKAVAFWLDGPNAEQRAELERRLADELGR